MSASAFERYAPFIQQYIYRKRWEDLRQVQVEACEAILDTDCHVLITSGTASGKTEAAFFPILTQLAERPSRSIGVMYIGPLKALINDQFERLSDLLAEREIPVWPWHGETPLSVRERALRQARGILQITPESLEAMLMRRPEDAVRLLCDLRFVVIDEIHALMGTDRGLQVLCLLTRLERLTHCAPRRIGLSATLSDDAAATAFLCAGTARTALVAGTQTGKRTIRLYVESEWLPEDEREAEAVVGRAMRGLYDACHRQKCLIFTNSRSEAETTIADLKSIARERGEPDIFRVHHGSVAASTRRETETALRESSGPAVAAATLTLELGIDIGDLDATVQLGAPQSCASFVQRLGRSGRRTGVSQMMFLHWNRLRDGGLLDQIPWTLLQSIAVIQLYLEERWVEPFIMKAKPFSLLIQQTLSILMSQGETRPSDLARSVLTLPAFSGRVTQEEYRLLLRHLVSEDILLRLDDGGIIVGNKGERLTNQYTFYAAFRGEEGWQVFCRDREIGTVDQRPEPGEPFALSGQCWQATDVDEDHRRVYAIPAKTRKAASWRGSHGEIHPRIAQRIRDLLRDDAVPAYLGEQAAAHLAMARRLMREHGLLEHEWLLEGDTLSLLPWCGTKILRSMEALLKGRLREKLRIKEVALSRYHLEIRSETPGAELLPALKKAACQLLEDQEELHILQPPLRTDKYDNLLPEALLQTAYEQNELALAEAARTLAALR